MADPVVLPKFELPGDRPHWAIRAAWMTGIVLVLSIIGLAAVIMHRHSLEAQAQIAKIEALARVKAEAEAKAAAVVAAAVAAREAREAALAAQRAAEAVPANTVASGGPGAPSADGTSSAAKAAKASRARHARAAHGAKGSKVASRTGGKTDVKSGSGKSGGSKSDPIDDLLKKMK